MKICGSCGLELDKSCFSNKQWCQSKQKRRCKQCVDKSTPSVEAQSEHGTSEAEAEQGGADGDLNEEPRPLPVGALVNDVVQCARASSKGQADGDEDEICGICLDVYKNPVQLSCGHSFCEVCLDGWHKKSKFDANQPRNCPMCRHRTKPSRENIAKLHAYSVVLSGKEDGIDKDFDKWKNMQEDLVSSLLKMGHTKEELNDMVEEYAAAQIHMPVSVQEAVTGNDAQTILDWLDSPDDEIKLIKLTSEGIGGINMLLVTVMRGFKELASLLLQQGAPVDAFDSHGTTPILAVLMTARVLNETITLLYEWGASLEHHVPGEYGAKADAMLATTPMFQNELVKRRCEIINLNQRKDLIGQTCIVEKYIAKKDRYKVTTEHAHETFLVGPDNLKRRDRTPDDPGYYVTFKDGEYKRHTFASNEECQEFVRNSRSGRVVDEENT